MPLLVTKKLSVNYSQMKLRGGLDLVTPTLDLPSGFLRSCENFEVSETGGYRRIDGYERFDGRPKPSDATFTIVQIDAYANTPTVGQTLTDNTTGATGVIISVQSNYMVLTKIAVALHTIGNVQKVGATTIGTMVAPTITLTALLIAQYKALAADNYRADITKPAGTGSVLGTATLVVAGVDKTYCFRESGGTVVLYVASTSGWTVVPYFREVAFTAGLGSGAGNVVPPADGEVITRGANTATIKRVVHQSGSWGAGTAAGYYVITTPAPGEFAAGAGTVPSGATFTISGASAAITMAVGGKFEFLVWNFFGQASGLRLYGCDGVNKMFEFDGTTLVPIRTGTSPDAPKHIGVLAGHLFGAFASSAIHSAPGLPYNYTAAAGASEIATGDTVTGFMSLQGSQTAPSLCIYGTRQSSMLYGTGVSTWTLARFDQGVGALDYSVQRMDDAYSLDDPGVIKLRAVQDFGNFSPSTLTANILPFIKAKRTILANSIIAREKSQYRLFFTDTTALYLTIVNGKYIGCGTQRFQHTVFCTSNSDNMRVNGTPDILFGTTDGYVMQFDKGTSFDGAAIDAYFDTNWETMGKPRIIKRYLKAALEAQGAAYFNFTLSYSLGYGSTAIKEPDGITYTVNAAEAPVWDSASLFWDLFTWDGTSFDVPSEIELKGRAETIRYRISSGTNYIASYTINSLYTHYQEGRGMR
jgi:hypothetical protein